MNRDNSEIRDASVVLLERDTSLTRYLCSVDSSLKYSIRFSSYGTDDIGAKRELSFLCETRR